MTAPESPRFTEPAEAPQVPASDGQDWRRLSRKMLLINPVTQLKNLLVPILAGFIGTARSEGGPPWWLFPLLGAVAAVLLGLAQWYTTRYRFTPEQLQQKRGLVFRTTLTAPLDRVRSVDLESSLLHRLLGLSKVQIGTGVDNTRITLDSLATGHAAGLRAELLHRSRVVTTSGQPTGAPAAAGPAGAGPAEAAVEGERTAYGVGADQAHPAPAQETELVRLDPSWLKYAPFGFTGLVAAAGAIGVGGQLLGEAELSETAAFEQATDTVGRLGILSAVLGGLAALIVLWLVLSTVSYVLAWWNLRVTRHPEGTLHVTRGLLTTRATSVEERRVRGVAMHEPLPLRMVRGARLEAIATGVGTGGTSALLPPSPIAVVRRLGQVVLTQDGPLEVALRRHGPAARRRIHFRAQRAVLVPVIALAAVTWWQGWSWVGFGAALVGFSALAALSGVDRYRNLGHALSGGYLVSGSGVLVRTRVALERDGIIGWKLSQSIFQRRVGLATLTATTAAGAEGYAVEDVPVDWAVSLARAATPGMLEEFLAGGAAASRPPESGAAPARWTSDEHRGERQR